MVFFLRGGEAATIEGSGSKSRAIPASSQRGAPFMGMPEAEAASGMCLAPAFSTN
ncbi:hypothetical protein [Variovorax soli]|uniref:hypothetical protein n=1 Tax=Variovorax soli TaxID=376815 RepID=UPI000A4BDEA5|nr:hypothetical protein [Variovorax soli]